MNRLQQNITEKRAPKDPTGMKPLRKERSLNSEELFSSFHEKRAGKPCPTCNTPMKREHYAQGMAVYGCQKCNKCFLIGKQGWIELAFSYDDFFLEK